MVCSHKLRNAFPWVCTGILTWYTGIQLTNFIDFSILGAAEHLSIFSASTLTKQVVLWGFFPRVIALPRARWLHRALQIATASGRRLNLSAQFPYKDSKDQEERIEITTCSIVKLASHRNPGLVDTRESGTSFQHLQDWKPYLRKRVPER